LDDTPVDLPRDIELGAANDVTVVSRALEDESSDDEDRGIIEVEIGNAGARAVVVEVLHSQRFPEGGKIVKESHRHRKKDGDYVWTLRVAPRKRVVLRYTLTVEYEEYKDNDRGEDEDLLGITNGRAHR
jgi:hypothetical protein